jgi:adenosylcobalamin-dependent ribonucleoside-triphosphate reductase
LWIHGMTHNVVLAALAVPDNKEKEQMNQPSTRAQVITRRTYNRPTSDDGKQFETWAETVARVIDHQEWLWTRAVDRELNDVEYAELYDLEQLMLDRKVLMSGRTLWLGGTQVAKTREASQFNCSFTHVETIYDVVDVLWLLLQGCGVGFKPIVGTLNGFSKPIRNIRVVRSTRTEKGGNEHNTETWDADSKTWTIQVGDSAEAWAKSIGKLLAGKYPADTLVLDFSQLRPAGERLKGYGWISSGDSAISAAYTAIANILNGRADSLLTRMDILDIVNHLGTILSSRRSAEIALFDYDQPEWEEFAVAKKDWWLHNNQHRTQSNNSLVFKKKPLKSDLEKIFTMMIKAGGSEPGFINEVEALRRAPWFKGANPCVEILLGNKAFCNLTETDIAKFKGDTAGLHNAIRLAARANYRQTCVNLQDGILQESWHLNNYFLRLCGVGLTGIAMRPDMGSYDYEYLKRTATSAAVGMSLELGLPAPKNVTCVKPSGTLSKIMDTTEGVHKPLGKYIFNNVQFSNHDPVVEKLRQANYRVINHPVDPSGVLVTFPVMWDGVQFDEIDGKEVNLESAVVQLERYKLLQTSWNQQNTSVTISYDPTEVPAIIDWLLDNWDCYVGVSFIYRTDPTKTAKDLGYLYLPQEVVSEQDYRDYVSVLSEVDLNNTNSFDEITDAECSTGACPIK